MKEIYLDRILRIYDDVHAVEKACSETGYAHTRIPENVSETITERLTEVLQMCGEIGLQASSAQANRVLRLISEGEPTYGQVYALLPELRSRIEDELEVRSFFHIDRPDLYSNADPFGGDVDMMFLTAAYDIEEAAKCLALSRNTACVMHLMRVVEVGLKAYGSGLNVMAQIKSAQPNWGEVLRVANEEIQKLNRSGDPDWADEKKSFYESNHALLHAVRVAWRNPTMHVENIYDEMRAEEVFNAVKSWMRHMAEHLDEDGVYL
jgi:hypothetical protein